MIFVDDGLRTVGGFVSETKIESLARAVHGQSCPQNFFNGEKYLREELLEGANL